MYCVLNSEGPLIRVIKGVMQIFINSSSQWGVCQHILYDAFIMYHRSLMTIWMIASSLRTMRRTLLNAR